MATETYTTLAFDMDNLTYENSTADPFVCVGAEESMFANGTVSKEQADLAFLIIFEVIFPVTCTIGFIGNTLCTVVLFKSNDKRSFTVYLKALTISDTVILIAGFMRFACKMIQKTVEKDPSKVETYCLLVVGYGIGHYVGNFSSTIITVMSIERFVAVVYPLRLKSFVLEQRPRLVVGIIALVQFILRVPTVIWTTVGTAEDCSTNGTLYFPVYREWSRDIVFRRVLFYTLNIIDRYIPVLIVICMNAGILITLKRRPKLSVARSIVRKEGTTSGMMEKNKITVTLVALSAFHVVQQISMSIIYILVTLAPEITIASREYYLYSVVINASIVVVALNAANDFIIFILSSKRFRELFVDLYCGWRRKPDTVHSETNDGSVVSRETSLDSACSFKK